MLDFDFLSTIVPILLALAGASERLVEAIKNLIPPLQVDPRGTTPSPAAGGSSPITVEQEESNSWREGWIGLLSVAVGILTAWLACDAGVFPKNVPTNTASVILYGLIIAGGTRLLNPIASYLVEIKNKKTLQTQQERAQTPRA